MVIQIKTVETRKDLRKFVLLPWQVYKTDPCWVPPLISEVKSILDLKKNPFWEHAEQKLFLALKNGKVVGRIAGIIDQNHINFHKEQVGFFGFFEVFNDYEIAQALFIQVREWLREKGMKAMLGPMNPSPSATSGFLVHGFDSSPVLRMTYNPKYYIDLIERFEFRKAYDYYAYIAPLLPKISEIISHVAGYAKERFPEINIRPMNLREPEKEKEKIKQLINSTFYELRDFVPVTDKEFDYIFEHLRFFIVPELILIAEFKEEPIGFAVNLPDYNQALKKINGRLYPFGWLKFLYYAQKINTIRGEFVGVLKKYRLKGVEALLYHEGCKNAYKLGYRNIEISKILEDNFLTRRASESFGGKIYKTYRIYEIKI